MTESPTVEHAPHAVYTMQLDDGTWMWQWQPEAGGPGMAKSGFATEHDALNDALGAEASDGE